MADSAASVTGAGAITGAASSVDDISSALSSSSYMGQMDAIQAQMQQNQVDKAKRDAENQRINGIADSAAQAGSAASQVKIQY
ncbi:hypothetical protein [Sodalis sp. dw_96]|uniref:hypothetical protein n=1 Tax=Sodalis sp. dw_96 TaxID=2719794 RepID=UPI001BD554DB|nr:hypothetical protein [Sodalis sp. dw_96]